MSVYSALFSQTFFGLLFCYLTITDVTMYLHIIDFQFPSCCTSQPKKTQPNHYCEQVYEDSYHQKNNSCTLCVAMFTMWFLPFLQLTFEHNSLLTIGTTTLTMFLTENTTQTSRTDLSMKSDSPNSQAA